MISQNVNRFKLSKNKKDNSKLGSLGVGNAESEMDECAKDKV